MEGAQHHPDQHARELAFLIHRLTVEVDRLILIRRSLLATADDFETLAQTAETVNTDLRTAAGEVEQAVADLRANPGDPAVQQKLDDAFARLQTVTGDHSNLASELRAAAETPEPPPVPPAP